MPNYNVSNRLDLARFNPTESGKVGQGVGRAFESLTSDAMGMVNAKGNEQKVQSLLQDYNAGRGAFGVTAGEGALPQFKARRLADLLLPIDPELSKRYSQRAIELESRANQVSDKDKADALARERMTGESDLTKMKLEHEAKLAQDKLNKPEKPADVDEQKLYRKALGAFTAGNYPAFFTSLHPSAQMLLSTPETATEGKIQSLIKNDLVKGHTFGDEISQSGSETTIKKAGAAESSYNLGQAKTDKEGSYEGLPSWVRPQAEKIQSNYYSIAKPLSASISESDKLASTLGSGDVKGIRAIASTFIFMKSLDPTSTVRESEFDSVAGASGAYGRFMNMLGKIESGMTITAEQANEMKQLANVWKEAAQQKLNTVKNQAEYVAEQMNIPKWAVTGQDVSGGKTITFTPMGK